MLSPCCSARSHSHGDRRRRCLGCGKTWLIVPPKKNGRPTVRLDGVPLTQYERAKRAKRNYKHVCSVCGEPAPYVNPLPMCMKHYQQARYHRLKSK